MPEAPLSHFWCDGVLMDLPEGYHYSRKQVNDRREVSLTAFIGTEGEQRYKLILKFGSKALSRYARGLDISSCLPGAPDEIDVSQENRTILIRLH